MLAKDTMSTKSRQRMMAVPCCHSAAQAQAGTIIGHIDGPVMKVSLPAERTPVNLIGKFAQTAAALWIMNVWFNRFNKDTGYRGGNATNMKEEFDAYGLSETTMYAVGAAKVSLAGLMLVGNAVPRVTRPASIGLATLMVGAIGMHIKVGDPVKRYLPALSVFSLATVSAVLNGDKRRPAQH